MTDVRLTRTNSGQGSRIRDYLSAQVEKGFLLNIDNNRRSEFLFNPAQFEEEYAASYSRHASLGLSHQRLQFTGNPNARISLELVFDQVVFNELRSVGRIRPITGTEDNMSVSSQNDVDLWRRKLLEMVYPRRAQRLAHASPPPILFYWPGMINMRVRVVTVRFRHVMFATKRPLPRIMIAQVGLEEEAMERMFSEDMIRNGTIRPWGASDRPRRRGS